MVGELITLPLRLSIRVARVTASGGLRLTGRAVALVSDAVSVLAPGGASSPARSAEAAPNPREPPAEPRRTDTGHPSAPPPPREPPLPQAPPRTAAGEVPTGSRPTSAPAPLNDQPAHLGDEPELVAEFAEPGAEDGAGAEVRIDEPWEGYDQTPANDLIVRLHAADSAELAAVKLYESSKRRRETVLTAVDRELQIKRGSRRQS